MCLFLLRDEFKALNVGCALDEGLANESDEYTVFYGERAPMWVRVKATGKVGHGSRFVEDLALEKLHTVIGRFLAYRAEQKARLEKADSCLVLGDVTTLNLTVSSTCRWREARAEAHLRKQGGRGRRRPAQCHSGQRHGDV